MDATHLTHSAATEHLVSDRWAFRVLRTIEEARDELREVSGGLAIAAAAAGDLVHPTYSPSPQRTLQGLEDVLAEVELLANHVRSRI